MRQLIAALCFVLPITLLGQTTGSVASPRIGRYPSPAQWDFGKVASVVDHNPASRNAFELDLRCRDASDLDLRDAGKKLLNYTFDSRTRFPPAERMPADFDPKRVMELGRNPGLGIRALHAEGVTGRGVGIGMVDQVLLVEHEQYKDRLRLYEEIGTIPLRPTELHGPAVASLAVGKTVGVAPEAELYYIASTPGAPDPAGGPFKYDFANYAKSVRRLLEINQGLPKESRLRVIAMQIGWNKSQAGFDEMMAACGEARDAGILVISSSVEQVHGFKFHGLGRSPLADPDRFESYEPGMFWASMFWQANPMMNTGRLLVPMDSRATAAPNGMTDYAFYRQGGWSWSIPYIAGAYALACQVEPTITPDRFWELAMKTGRMVPTEHEGKQYTLGPILDMQEVVRALKAR